MASNVQKTPLSVSIPAFARQTAADAIQLLGRALPCSVVSVSGQIVTVSFEVNAAPFTLPNITIPITTSAYDWLPIQVGDKGFTVAADVYLGGVSGLGGGVADLTQRGNLSTLIFVPISNSAWSAPGGDDNMRIVQGPDGVRIQDTTGGVVAIFSKTTGISLSFSGHSLTITSSGVTIDGKAFLTHEHSGVTTGSGDTGGVV